MGELSNLGSLSITPLAPEDIPSVSKLFKVTIADAFEREGLGHLQEDIRQETAAKIQMANAALNPQDTDVYFWLARSGGVVIGTVSYAPCGEDIRNCTDNRLSAVGELGSLYVLPEIQGQGVGSALIEEVTVFLRKRGFPNSAWTAVISERRTDGCGNSERPMQQCRIIGGRIPFIWYGCAAWGTQRIRRSRYK